MRSGRLRFVRAAVVGLVSLAVVGMVSSRRVQAESFGSLEIRTEPGATLVWDGVALGTSDDSGRMQVFNIPPGAYTVSARKPGLQPVDRDIEVLPGNQTLEFALTMAPSPAAVQASLPDPFARRSTPVAPIVAVTFMVAIAAGALWLGRRRRWDEEEEIPPPPDGPRVVMVPERGGRRPPRRFFEDLRHRETVLESLEERGQGRPRPKVIELPADDRGPRERGG